jgi:hypothetical protein
MSDDEGEYHTLCTVSSCYTFCSATEDKGAGSELHRAQDSLIFHNVHYAIGERSLTSPGVRDPFPPICHNALVVGTGGGGIGASHLLPPKTIWRT